MHKPREPKPTAQEVSGTQMERILPISAEQASLSISRHFAASTK